MSAIGLNRHNDTPIGGTPEFRGNMQGGEVWLTDQVPVWDGTKFAPGTNSALLLAYGGLTTNEGAVVAADGSLIQNWGAATPLNGTALQVTVDPVAGTLVVIPIGVYMVDFQCNVQGLVNNQEYEFRLNLDGVDTDYGAVISGTNSLSVGSASFSIMAETLGASIATGVSVTNAGGNTYQIVTASFNARRIG